MMITDVSVDRQDSTTDYAADNSSAEQSSTGTPLTMSPRRGVLLASRHTSHDTSGGGTFPGGESGDQGSVPSGAHLSSLTPPTPARFRHNSQDARSHSPESETSHQQNQDPSVLRQRALRQHSFFQLHVHLKRGENLVARDACGKLLPQYSSYQSGDTARAGTSDPYVKFKVQGKLVHKSKTVYKDLNPIWDESFTVAIEDPFEPVVVKVFDYDWGLQDDFMGLASIDLATLELDK
ncbi:Multiple C2 and transmembrane domain-containing protein-like 2 [Homarus americanus]|uniref:Multiple C2 and transmembrane domain-containing protein-like 2 n=1 Tax=Homarus americanus TaxID=6706 RepID=A0A8J5K6E1_HOMAM|nr:Multiple C2 and transmembrane domain-containing protein-like 2 [Homarus americanus]